MKLKRIQNLYTQRNDVTILCMYIVVRIRTSVTYYDGSSLCKALQQHIGIVYSTLLLYWHLAN
jgi:hypothetical protein